MKITTLRTTGCPDERSCVSVHDLDRHPGRRYVITKKESDPEVLRAFAPLIGPDEQLGYGPVHMFPVDVCTCGGPR